MSSRSIKQDLIEARALIAEAVNWTQGWYARDRIGKICGATTPEAVKWDAAGALIKIADEDSCAAIDVLHEAMYRNKVEFGPTGGVTIYNDHHTHSEIIAAFDLAIEIASDIVSEAA